jgi:hypothetical protein
MKYRIPRRPWRLTLRALNVRQLKLTTHGGAVVKRALAKRGVASNDAQVLPLESENILRIVSSRDTLRRHQRWWSDVEAEISKAYPTPLGEKD